MTVRKVAHGATWRGELLGKSVRFYSSLDGDPIHYAINGNKVPLSDGCRPLMDMDNEVPADLDYSAYIADAEELLRSVGCNN